MKKLSLKSKVLLGAFLVGATGAVAHEVSLIPSANDSLYRWDDNMIRSVAQAQIDFECDGAGATCATGTWVSGDPDDPSSVEIKHN